MGKGGVGGRVPVRRDGERTGDEQGAQGPCTLKHKKLGGEGGGKQAALSGIRRGVLPRHIQEFLLLILPFDAAACCMLLLLLEVVVVVVGW